MTTFQFYCKYWIDDCYIIYRYQTKNKNLIYASYNGDIKVINLMLKYGANDYNCAMAEASLGGHIGIVKLMINLGARDYELAIKKAKYRNHNEIIFLLKLKRLFHQKY